MNFALFQSGWWLILLVCSEMAEVWVHACISLSCSLILSCIDLPGGFFSCPVKQLYEGGGITISAPSQRPYRPSDLKTV